MRRRMTRRVVTLTAGLLVLAPGVAAAGPRDVLGVVAGNRTGQLPDGATWTIDVPDDWNGTLLLFSHGLVPPGASNPATDASDPITAAHLLGRGFALAGTSYAGTGFAVEDALRDQAALLDVFADTVARPVRTVAWGNSLGGLVSAALAERLPGRVDGAVAMCAPLAGSVGLWNSYLDTLFALKALLLPDAAIDLVRVGDPMAAVDAMRAALVAAQATPEGRAKIALAAALGDIPGRSGADVPHLPRPDAGAREAAQFRNLDTVVLFGFALRAEMEGRAGGNPSTNAGVDYRQLLRRSTGRDEVATLYRRAGRSLSADLAVLAAAPRVPADAHAVDYLHRFVSLNGDLQGTPVLTLHNTDDPLVGVEHERAYGRTVRRSGNASLLRQAFTDRGGHCLFTPAETVAGLDTMLRRLDSGRWPATSAAALNARAAALGPALNVHFEDGSDEPVPTRPAFVPFRPATFLAGVDR